MTIIAAYIDADGNTAIGCDTAVDCAARQELQTKLVRFGSGLVVGASGYALWHRYLLEQRSKLVTDVEALADGWVTWARGRGHGKVDDGQHQLVGRMLIARPGEVVEVYGDGGYAEPRSRYAAIGVGECVALGALWAARESECTAVDAVSWAVEACLAHEPGCGGRAVVEVVGSAEAGVSLRGDRTTQASGVARR